jgi:branched-chain amino acid transport system ATP-binding protein
MLPQGVRKLLDIAMTTVGEPRIALLDEPTSGISVDEKFSVMDTLMSALRRQEVTVLFVEHDMEIVGRYGERVIAFHDGKVIADGSPSEVLADQDVRQYVVGAELHRDRHMLEIR